MAANRMERRTSPEKIVQAAEQLNPAELDALVGKLLLLRAQRRVPSLSSDETRLLTQINTGLPTDVQNRYDELIAKLRDESLTESEHEELLRLGDLSESMNVERVKALVELASLRHISLDELMDTLGIKPRAIE